MKSIGLLIEAVVVVVGMTMLNNILYQLMAYINELTNVLNNISIPF